MHTNPTNQINDIIIIGAGAAGLTASIYCKRGGKSVRVLEGKYYGGQIIDAQEIENYPGLPKVSGFDFAQKLYSQAMDLGIDYTNATVTGIDLGSHITVKTKDKSYMANAVIIATGAKKRKLGLENEERLTGKGVSYCATCDGAFYKDKTVAVVGGGNTAAEDALVLSSFCREVYIINRTDRYRAEAKRIRQLKSKENVIFMDNFKVTALKGEDKLCGVTLENTVTSKTMDMSLDGIFIAIGSEPDNQYLSPPIKLDNDGYILTDINGKTNLPGIYAAGDCCHKNVRQLTTAVSDGTISGLSAVRDLEK